MSDITIVENSEKSFVVIGDTRAYKSSLKALNGKWGNWKAGTGWMFSNNKKEEVENVLNTPVTLLEFSNNVNSIEEKYNKILVLLEQQKQDYNKLNEQYREAIERLDKIIELSGLE